MKFQTTTIQRWQRKLARRLRRAAKEVYQAAQPRKTRPLQLLFIFGCQRSGTTLMTEIFEKDWNACVYPEHSQLSSQDSLHKLRLNPLDNVQAILDRGKSQFTVLKPLVETQNAPHLLDFFAGSRALWLYRHYNDVSLSNMRRFGKQNGIKNLSYIAECVPGNWRNEKLPSAVQALVMQHFSETMNPYDAAALFWYVRNQFLFELGLEQDERVLLVRYSDLVSQPLETMTNVYQFIQQPFPGPQLLTDVHSNSVGKGQRIPLSPEIEDLCTHMLTRLDTVYQQQREYAS